MSDDCANLPHGLDLYTTHHLHVGNDGKFWNCAEQVCPNAALVSIAAETTLEKDGIQHRIIPIPKKPRDDSPPPPRDQNMDDLSKDDLIKFLMKQQLMLQNEVTRLAHSIRKANITERKDKKKIGRAHV